MKEVMIVIQNKMYQETKQALINGGFGAFSSFLVFGKGKKPVQFTAKNGQPLDNKDTGQPMLAKKMIMVWINDEEEEKLVEIVLTVNRGGNCGDGKIFVTKLNGAMRIRTGEKGRDALI
ncbi:nitrogen regulatory protein P-II [Syntrophobotulus glycolicus DSM 8271]|uniref:Nitrogen regulatory protein P-II n=1 Tax=Syntrophobotulus glycolicus (strain DSM 8271 / FlGlyR) TaxID=645991 RepID=F0T2J0_SYNGF|nr:P-II family nitrogen regulator [Syntrophobotulus glycolicus]ADY55308.1 nitrogen regulatory protein P-II [Syntrophobotulus glycolicus DSM 8271]